MTNIPYNAGALSATDAISEGWNLAGSNYGQMLGVAVVTWLIMFASGCIPFASFFLTGPLMVGLYACYIKQIDGQTFEFGEMFSGFKKFVPAMVVGLIESIPLILMQIVQYVSDISQLITIFQEVKRSGDFFQASQSNPFDLDQGIPLLLSLVILGFFLIYLVVAIIFFFAYMLLAEHDIGPIDALKLSASAAFANIGSLIGLVLLQGLILVAGVFVVCIGFFLALPICYAASIVAYRQVFPKMTPNVPNIPPPPSSYGDAYGQAGSM